MRFADSEAADGITGEIEIEKLPRTFAAQIGKPSPATSELPLD